MQVSFTPSTVPLLLLAAYLLYRAKGKLLPVAMFMSVFQAASIVNIAAGSLQIGVQPTYVILLAALAARLAGRRPPKSRNWLPASTTSLLLTAFVAYAMVSAFVYPFLFKGVLISNSKFGFGIPLKWEVGHLNQLFYLVLSFALYLVAAYWTTPAELTKSINWFVGGILLASVIGFYQLLSIKTGLPFPKEILHSSPTYSMFEGYEIDGFPRMNSTFTEAAAAAFSLNVGFAIVLWRLLSRADSIRNLFYIAVIGMGLLLTVSTTGYICLVFLLVVAACRYFAPWKGGSDSFHARVLLLIPVCLVGLAFIGSPAAREPLVRLLHTVLLDKTTTLSYQQRTAWNHDALTTAADTHWLGAGWGVCRASSFIPTMIGNVGIPGSLLFVVFCAFLLRPALHLSKIKVTLHGAVIFALTALLLDLSVSAPELANPIIWLIFAIAAKFAAGRVAVPSRVLQPQPQLQRWEATA